MVAVETDGPEDLVAATMEPEVARPSSISSPREEARAPA